MNQRQRENLANPLFLSERILDSGPEVAGRIVARHGQAGEEALRIARPTFRQTIAIKRARRAYLSQRQ
ncbi:hypothetical protein KKA02_04715 [Patescibacteria group bacterium]|nr:hypothetical protein [Patescibacteria group bacterium]